MDWTPRSQRSGIRNYDGPYIGVPDHLRPHLTAWIIESLYDTWAPKDGAQQIAMRLRINVDLRFGIPPQLVAESSSDDNLMLDVAEGVLKLMPAKGATLEDLLSRSGSSYAVVGDQIVDRVNSDMQNSFDSASSVEDEASENLREAWAKAYGRAVDPSDAWDHAIKTVECILRPTVLPADDGATLGRIIGILGSQSIRWKCVFPGADKSGDISNLVGLLRLIWPNPDRHGPTVRKPTLDESRAVVTLVTSIVQWHRQGSILELRS